MTDLVIISKLDRTLSEGEFPIYYGDHNFIFVDTIHCYYFYYNRNRSMCGTGIDWSKPLFIDLKPSDIISFKTNDLKRFIQKDIQTYPTPKKAIVTISSFTDTIKNESVEYIVNAFKQSKECLLNYCLVTEEVRAVLEAKIQKKEYDSKKTLWKIGFGNEIPSTRETIKFIEPVVEN